MTGTREATIFEVISRLASSSPPGVFRRSRTAAAFSWAAWSMAWRDDFDRDGVDNAVDVDGKDFRRGANL